MEVISIKPFLAMMVSLLGAALIVINRNHPNRREGCSLAAASAKFLIVLTMIPDVIAGNTLHFTLLSFLPGLSIAFRVDALGILFATVASFLWILTTIYSIGYMRQMKEHAQTRYYLCFALTLSATMGVAFSANLLTLYLFYEMLTIVTYPLVTHKETDEAYAGGNKYLFYLLGTSKAFLLAAVILTYVTSGTLSFQPGGIFTAAASASPTVLVLIYFLFLFGIGKAAIMPVHAWLPAAMVAPTPVSALLHAVAVVNTGVFCVLRIILHVFGVDMMQMLGLGVATAALASFTIIMASIYALTRDNLKARLAYSTISQLSYIILGGALLNPIGMAGGVMHIANHAFSKITLFFCAGSIYVTMHKTEISQMGGIGRQMPWTMTAFSIGALSMIGVPPLSGFITKWHLALGAIEAKELSLLIVLIVSTLLNAGYFIPIIYKAFFEMPKSAEAHGHAADHHAEGIVGSGQVTESFIMVFPLMLTACISLVLGFYPDLLLTLVNQVVK
ncbi:MAG: monovalent cation/H+ antiporter subunit D family protein [Nitrospirota bacterium]